MAFDITGAPPDATSWRFDALHISATVAHDAPAFDQSMARMAGARRKEAGPDSVRLYGPTGSVDALASSSWIRHAWRVWWTPPSLWREEIEWHNGQHVVIIVRPDVTLYYVSVERALYTSDSSASNPGPLGLAQEQTRLPTILQRLDEFPLTGFRLAANEWDLSTLGPESYLGRLPRLVRASRRTGALGRVDPVRPRYWPWVQQFQILVDDDLGILLDLQALAGGKPVGRITLDTLHEGALPESVFSFAPPPGTRTERGQRSSDR